MKNKKVTTEQPPQPEPAPEKNQEGAPPKGSFSRYLWKKISSREYNPFKSGVNGIFDEYGKYKENKQEVLTKFLNYENVTAGAKDDREFYVLLISSALIATLGLIQNSAAVVIGAMIVAPLMGPIFSLSAAALHGSWQTISTSFATIVKGVLAAVGVAALIAALTPGIEITPEIAARSHPTLYDILVALGSGVVGAFAFVSRKVSNALPGVAISVALVPPLTTVGIGVGFLDTTLIFGAGILFLVNLVGIFLAALLVFYFVDLHPEQVSPEKASAFTHRVVRHGLVSLFLLIILSVPLSLVMISSFQAKQEEKEMTTYIQSVLPEEIIYNIQMQRNGDNLNVNILLLNEPTKDFQPEYILQTYLNKNLGVPGTVTIYTFNRYSSDLMPQN